MSLRFRPAPLALAALLLAGPLGAALGAPVAAQPLPGAAAPPADPARAEAAYDAARGLFSAGLYAPAARAFGAFLETYPRDVHAPQALYYQAEATLASGDDGGAAALFERFDRLHPDHPFASRARLALGRYYWAAGRLPDAERALNDALSRRLPPADRAEAGYLLGLVFRSQGRPGPAVEAFQEAASGETPTAPLALYAAGETQAARGDWAGAAASFGALASRYPDSPANLSVGLARAEAFARLERWEEVAAEAAARRPTLSGDAVARADLLAGEALIRLGRPGEAVAVLERIPDTSAYDRRAMFGRARVAYDAADYALAASLFDAVRAAPQAGAGASGVDALTHESTYLAGLSLKRLLQLGDAEALLREAVAQNGAYVPEALMELGLLLYERRGYDESARLFARVVEEYDGEPFAGEAARMEGESHAAAGRIEAARAAFERAEALGGGTAGTRAEIAFQDAYGRFAAANYAAALPALLRVAEIDPGGERAGEALFWAGEAAFQLAQYARSEEIHRRFLREHPEHPRADAARYALAYTHFRRRDYGSAADAFERFLSAYTGASGATVPYRPDALFRLGDSYFALGRFADARAVYERAAEAAPRGQGRDYALFQTAQAFAAEGNTSRAIISYERLATDFATSDLVDEALYAQGTLLLQSGRDTEAAAVFARSAAARPGSPIAPRALVGEGDARYNAEDYEGAERAYRRALERYPESDFAADALEGLGYALDALGRVDEFEAAVARFEATTTNPLARARVQLRRAEVALAAGDDALAVQRAEALLAIRPPAEVEPQALLTLAEAYGNLSEYAAAAAALRRLLDRHPTSPLAPEAALRLASLRLAAGDANQALLEAQRFQTRYPDDAERVAQAVLVEVQALRRIGRTDEATQRLDVLLTLYPDTAAAQEAARLPGN